MSRSSGCRSLVAGALALVVVVCQGCGTGEYEKRMKQTIAGLKNPSAAGGNSAPGGASTGQTVKVPGTSLVLTIPSAFKKLGSSVDPRRSAPLMIPIDTRELVTFEASVVDATQGKQHYYCYLFTMGADAASGGAAQQIAGSLQGAGGTQDVTLNSLSWQTAGAVVQQEFFYIDPNGEESYRSMDGRMDVWSYLDEDSGNYVILFWRTPDSIAGYVKLDQTMRQVAESLNNG